jgi:16S rRNA (guanine966-N2)-methyltransferase
MRIIAGQRRGHKIDGPRDSAATRPTSDMVRESIFNIVRELVVDRLVIDLFAGTGAIGLEALSRGAERAIFVERDRENVSLIIRNIATLRYEDRAQVKLADVYRWVRSFQFPAASPVAVFLDPPYREYEAHAPRLNQMIAHLVDHLPAASVIALEAGRILDETILPELPTWDVRRYGDTRIAIKVIPERPGEKALLPLPPGEGGGEGPLDPLPLPPGEGGSEGSFEENPNE